MESVNERLKDLRYAVDTEKLTQDDVAELTGIPKATVADYEKEGRNVPSDALIKYCKAFNVSADYILGLTNARTMPNFEIHELGLTDKAMYKLKDNRINSSLLSEIIEHDVFNKMLLDAEIYVSGYVDESVQRYNSIFKIERAKLRNAVTDDVDMEKELTLLDYIQVDQDVFFSGRISKAMLTILKDIKYKHKDDASTSDYQNGLSDQDVFINTYFSSSGTKVQRFLNGMSALLKIKNNEINNKNLENLINEKALEDVLGQSAIVEPDDRKRRRKK